MVKVVDLAAGFRTVGFLRGGCIGAAGSTIGAGYTGAGCYTMIYCY
jgi:hypothetical protein